MGGTSDEKMFMNEDGLQNHCSLVVIGIQPVHHEIYGFRKVTQEENLVWKWDRMQPCLDHRSRHYPRPIPTLEGDRLETRASPVGFLSKMIEGGA